MIGGSYWTPTDPGATHHRVELPDDYEPRLRDVLFSPGRSIWYDKDTRWVVVGLKLQGNGTTRVFLSVYDKPGQRTQMELQNLKTTGWDLGVPKESPVIKEED